MSLEMYLFCWPLGPAGMLTLGVSVWSITGAKGWGTLTLMAAFRLMAPDVP